jgi:hypothetical protein
MLPLSVTNCREPRQIGFGCPTVCEGRNGLYSVKPSVSRRGAWLGCSGPAIPLRYCYDWRTVRKQFFFEKKNQKTFANERAWWFNAHANERKFLLLFSKRSAFSWLSP